MPMSMSAATRAVGSAAMLRVRGPVTVRAIRGSARAANHIAMRSASSKAKEPKQPQVLVKKFEEEGIAYLLLDAPPVNALSGPFFKEIERTVQKLEKDETIKALVLGSTSKAFCAGLDLKLLRKPRVDELKELKRNFNDCLKALFSTRLFTIAAINGSAIAGGCILTLCCDYRVIHPKASIGMNEVTFGLVPPPFPAALMFEYMGRRSELALMLGTIYKADEACRYGLVDEVLDAPTQYDPETQSSEFIRKCHEMALAMTFNRQHELFGSGAASDIPARAWTKELIRDGTIDRFFSKHMRSEDVRLFTDSVTSPSVQDMVARYLDSLSAKKENVKSEGAESTDAPPSS